MASCGAIRMSLGGGDRPLPEEETETQHGEVSGLRSHSDWHSAVPYPTPHAPTRTLSHLLGEAKNPWEVTLSTPEQQESLLRGPGSPPQFKPPGERTVTVTLQKCPFVPSLTLKPTGLRELRQAARLQPREQGSGRAPRLASAPPAPLPRSPLRTVCMTTGGGPAPINPSC